jgi:hypothetical protein
MVTPGARSAQPNSRGLFGGEPDRRPRRRLRSRRPDRAVLPLNLPHLTRRDPPDTHLPWADNVQRGPELRAMGRIRRAEEAVTAEECFMPSQRHTQKRLGADPAPVAGHCGLVSTSPPGSGCGVPTTYTVRRHRIAVHERCIAGLIVTPEAAELLDVIAGLHAGAWVD